MSCSQCGKDIPSYLHYCGWKCQIEGAKAAGGKVITPNNLPIQCIMADGTMLECEGGDHPDYKFPVDVSDGDGVEMHALIYEDGSIALTIHECRYFLWVIRDGSPIRSPVSGLRLTEASRTKIQALRKM